MVQYQKTKFKEWKGDVKATISNVETEENTFFKADDENSTKSVLNITFDCVDQNSLETIQFVQKFVKPLTGGNGLFQQLLDAVGFVPDLDDGDFDEQDLVGLKLILTFGKNKNGYQIVKTAVAAPKTAGTMPKPVAKKEKASDGDDDLPFGN